MKVSKNSWVVKIQQEDREKFIDMARSFGYDFRKLSVFPGRRNWEDSVWYGFKMMYGEKKVFLTYEHDHVFSKKFVTIEEFINYHINMK